MASIEDETLRQALLRGASFRCRALEQEGRARLHVTTGAAAAATTRAAEIGRETDVADALLRLLDAGLDDLSRPTAGVPAVIRTASTRRS